MGRPAGGYQLQDGQRVPGVTTITGRFADKTGIIIWANREGLEGRNYTDKRDAAADVGTCVHAMVEADWHHHPFDRQPYKPEILERADHAFLAYLEWKDATRLTVTYPELSLVSERYRFGGTIDAIMVRGHLMLGDWKSSNGIYPDMLVQVAGGYALLWEEHYPDEPLHGVQLIRFSKPEKVTDPVSFTHHYWSAEIFAPCKAQFLRFLEAYDTDKDLKRYCR